MGYRTVIFYFELLPGRQAVRSPVGLILTRGSILAMGRNSVNHIGEWLTEWIWRAKIA